MFFPGSFGSPYFFGVGRHRVMKNTRIFIDYWNFQLMWNERTHSARCDWPLLPGELTRAAETLLAGAGLGSLTLKETRVYAGYEAGREAKLKN